MGPDDIVTVACAWSPDAQEHCFYGQDFAAVASMLDRAQCIYTYNGVEFDLPRFAKHCGRSVDAWALKTVDPLFVMKHAMGYGACARLNDVLQENGYEPKSGSGLQAIEFWNDGRHEDLRAYCMDDARLTYRLCEADEIRWAKKWIVRIREARVLGFQ